ncbi:hypothetical protein RIF29_05941 [Crotalaria pallida]|uniref:Uncharacterized protein n=1 Tax=Crotalaria pallida TaxID=3830 RepID=A0AAN9J2M5_CROPI
MKGNNGAYSVATNYGDRTTPIKQRRALKENVESITSNNESNVGDLTLDDYKPRKPPPIDNVTGESHPGPIEHGTPFTTLAFPKPPPSGLPDKPEGS